MASREKQPKWGRREDSLERSFSSLSLGIFLVLMVVIYLTTPGLQDKAVAFLKDFKPVEIAPNIFLPMPTSSHPVVYTAAAHFCLAFGISQAFILILRFILRSPLSKKAETFSNIVLWLGASLLLTLLTAEAVRWFTFLGGVVILIGLLIIITSLAKLFSPHI